MQAERKGDEAETSEVAVTFDVSAVTCDVSPVTCDARADTWSRPVCVCVCMCVCGHGWGLDSGSVAVCVCVCVCVCLCVCVCVWSYMGIESTRHARVDSSMTKGTPPGPFVLPSSIQCVCV